MAPPVSSTQLETLKASGDLPSPKGVALAIIRLSAQDDVSMAEMARIIRTDPAFVGRLIKAANGVIGYGRRPIASVQDALTVLGMPAVRTMALGFSLMTHYKSGPCRAFDYAKYWSASVLSAVATQAVCLRTRVVAPDESYCLGLLARVGELAFATLYPAEYAEVLDELKRTPGLRDVELEDRRFGMNHAELGAAMLADWGVPRIFCDAAFHAARSEDCGAPEGSRERTVAEMLMFAQAVSTVSLCDASQRSVAMRRVLMLGSRLGFDEETTQELCNGIVRDWVDWCALLSIEAHRIPPFESIQLDQSGEATAVATEAATREAPASPAEAKEAEPVVARLTVLMAMQDAVARTAVRQLLAGAGYEVAEVGDIAMAAEFALDYEPDILMLDWEMVGDGGREFLATVRKTRIGQSLFIVILADRPDDEFRLQAFEFGADDVLGKPVVPRLLLARLAAGRRLSTLHHEIQRDREEIRHYAAELAISNRRLQEVALADPLTGFPNRRYFLERLAQEWAASTRNKRPICCLVLDIDGLQQINQAYGNDTGDVVLRQVALAVRSVVRAHDVLARIGGDEFAVLCPDTPLEAAQACGERLRHAVGSQPVEAGTRALAVTLSIGVASRDSSTVDADSLLRRAEQGVVISREAGRNRVSSVQLRPQGSSAA